MTFLKAQFGIGKKPLPGEVWAFDSEEGPWPKENKGLVRILDVKDGWVRYSWASGFRTDERMKIRAFRWCYNFYQAAS